MSGEDSDDSEEFISLQDLAKVRRKAYLAPGAKALRMAYLDCCASQDWSLGMLRPTLQFFGADRYTSQTLLRLICR